MLGSKLSDPFALARPDSMGAAKATRRVRARAVFLVPEGERLQTRAVSQTLAKPACAIDLSPYLVSVSWSISDATSKNVPTHD